jgi:very-short-patch-repair endonuclease
VTRSELEERFLAVLDAHALPRPQINAYVRTRGRLLECDCVWWVERLAVELDGHAAHSPRTAFERDRARDRALSAAGWRVLRITWRQLHREAEAVAGDLRTLLGNAG